MRVALALLAGLWIGGAGAQEVEVGIASIYGLNNGSGDSATQPLACGGRLNVKALTAAAPSAKKHPCGSKVRVTNLANNLSVIVTINDRGPFAHGRILDMTPAAAAAIHNRGLARVRIEAIVH